MRISQFAAIGAAGLALFAGASAIAQSSSLLESKERAYGYVDLKTGQFHPVAEVAVAPETTPTTKTYTGTIEAVITTTIDSTLPKGSTILCDIDVTASVDGELYTEVASAPATISGTKATCTVKLPYSWIGPTGGSASSYYFTGQYKVTATYEATATEPLTDFNVLRQTTGSLTGPSALAIPAPGTVTSFAFNPVI